MNVRQLQREAARHGARIENDSAGDEHVHQCCAPRGKVWAAAFLHTMVVRWASRDEKDAALQDGIERMQFGLTDCTEPACEECSP